MLEYKFRVWNKMKKEWVKPEHLTDPTRMSVDVTDTGFRFLKNTYFIFCQYIGFKDKKGFEACIGDLVGRGGKVEEIIYDSIHGWFAYKHSNGMMSAIGGSIRWSSGAGWHLDGEIIGNIYENPELLEAKSNAD